MERGLPRTSLHGSALAGVLAQLAGTGRAPAQRPAAPPSFVDGMVRWLGWADAIPLAAAINTPPAAATSAAGRLAEPVAREFERVRKALARAIDDDAECAHDADFAPHRRRYGALQQAMETAIGALRAQARAAVAKGSPDLQRLAAVDAVMDDALHGREQALLAALPAQLQAHFERLQKARRAAADDAAAPHLWLPAFRHDMRRMLQAELDLRLQPTLGLLEALRSPTASP